MLAIRYRYMGSLILRRGPQFSDDLGTGDPQISVVLGIPNSPEIWERGGGGGGGGGVPNST